MTDLYAESQPVTLLIAFRGVAFNNQFLKQRYFNVEIVFYKVVFINKITLNFSWLLWLKKTLVRPFLVLSLLSHLQLPSLWSLGISSIYLDFF